MRDYRDLVIEDLAGSEAALLDQIVNLVRERDAYRLLSQQSFHLLHDQHVQIMRLRESVRAMREERRRCLQGRAGEPDDRSRSSRSGTPDVSEVAR